MTIPLSAQDIHQRHVAKQFYIVTDVGDIQEKTKKAFSWQAFITVSKLLTCAQDPMRSTDDRKIFQACAYDYLRSLEKKGIALEDQETYDRLLAETLILLMGQQPKESLVNSLSEEIHNNSPWFHFIQKNHIHYLVHRENLPYDEGLVGKICVDNHWYDWSDLTETITEEGRSFSYNRIEGIELFKTDETYKLKDYCYAGSLGVLSGNVSQAETIEKFFKRPPTGKYWLSLYSMNKGPTDLRFGKSHSYMGLEDAEGNLFYAGQYGLETPFSVSDAFAPFGKKKMGIETPDRYTGLPLAHYFVKEGRIEITKDEYEKLETSIREDKQHGVSGSLINRNCTEYVKKKLELIGLKTKTSIKAQEFFFRLALNLVPKSWAERAITWQKGLPKWVKKVAHFNPLLYPFVVVSCAVVTLLSGFRSDVSVINAIVRPWKVKIQHPVVLAEGLETFEKEQERYAILKAKIVGESPIVDSLKETSKVMGFSEDSEGRFLIKEVKHITQHRLKPLPLMIVGAIYEAITHRLKNWIWEKERIDNQTMFVYLHTLMNHRVITPYHFASLKETIGKKKAFTEEVKRIVASLYQKKLIDRRSLIHLNGLLEKGKTQESLTYVISITLLNGLNHKAHLNTLQELITPEAQWELNAQLKYYHQHYAFSVAGVKSIQALVSRVHCYEWAGKIGDEESRKEIMDAIKSRDEKLFARALKFYFHKASQKHGLTVTEIKIFEEMANSVDHPKGESLFVHFAHVMQTQARIQEMEQKLMQVEKVVSSHASSITSEGIEDLKRLHQNMGMIFNADVGYTGSSTLLSLLYGKLRQRWEMIDDVLNRQIIPLSDEVDFWPDIGFREVKVYSGEKIKENRPPVSEKKKKIFFAYHSLGIGHFSTTKALAESLGDAYRISACEIPDEILIERDPLFNLLGREHSVTTLYNTLVAGNHWETVRLIKKIGAIPAPEEEIALQKDLIRRKLLQECPDVIVATYERQSHLLLEVAKEMGIPFVQVYTDMLAPLSDSFKKVLQKDPDYPHQKMLMPYPLEEMQKNFTDLGLQSDRIASIGYPVNPAFSKQMDKDELKKKYGVKEGQKVILCMNGGCGGGVPWPQKIAEMNGLGFSIKLVVITSKNESFFEEVQKIVPKDNSLEILAKGFIEPQEMAELTEIADLVISKPGGATIAENLVKKNFLLLDTRFSYELTGEQDAADILKKHELAETFDSEEIFEDKFKESLQKQVPDVHTFHGDHVVFKKEVFIDHLNKMIKVADQDPLIQSKRFFLKTKEKNLVPLYPVLDTLEPSREAFEFNLGQILKWNEQLNPREIIPSLKSALWEASKKDQFVKFNLEKSQFEVTTWFQIDDMRYAVDVIRREMRHQQDFPAESIKQITQMILKKKERLEYKSQIQEMLKELADVDFHRVSKEIRTSQVVEKKLETILDSFLVPEAKKKLQDWLDLTTSRNRKNPHKYNPEDEKILTQKQVLNVFLNYPEELDFMTEYYLHRKVSAFDHKLQVNGENHLHLLYQGKETSISELMGKFKYVNDRIIAIEDEQEYTYTYDKGLVPIEEGRHPVHWRNEIPLFKKKKRKNNDYRLDLMTVISKKQNHGWVRLKDPEGHVFSVGTFWDPDYQLEQIRCLNSLPGYVRAGDLQEFTAQEKNWKKTSFVINQEIYDRIREKVVYYQKHQKGYNLVNENCVTFAQKLLYEIGIRYRNSEDAVILFTMPFKEFKKFLIRNETVRTVIQVACYPLRLLHNLVLSGLGMWEKQDLSKETPTGFSKLSDLFTWDRALIDHPSQLRLVQEVIDEDLLITGHKRIDIKQILPEMKLGV